MSATSAAGPFVQTTFPEADDGSEVGGKLTDARQTCTAAFKLQTVKLLTGQHRSVAEVGHCVGVSENCLQEWQGRPSPRHRG